MGRVPMNATTTKDIQKLGKTQNKGPMPAPREKKDVKGYKAQKGDETSHGGGWF